MGALTDINSGTYKPSMLTEAFLNDAGNIVSVGEDTLNQVNDKICAEYIHEDLIICPHKDILHLASGKANNLSLNLVSPQIYNSSSNISDYILKIVFNNIWKFKGNSTLEDSGVVNIQHGYFGLCSKILNYKQGATYNSFLLNLNLILTEEEKQSFESGTILWKKKVVLSEEAGLTNLASSTPPSGYEQLKAYKISFDFLFSGTFTKQGADIEFFTLKESNLLLRYTGVEYKLNKLLNYENKTFIWDIPLKLVIKNELIQCYPVESYVLDSSFDIIDYGILYTYSYDAGISSYYVVIKFWCPDTKYLTQQIVSLNSYYLSTDITDLKNSVRQFKINIANPASDHSDVGYWRMIFHLNYKDNLGNEFSRDYNVIFNIVV